MAPLPQPDLPEPAHPNVDSMLSRKFGKEVANYFSGLSSLFSHPAIQQPTKRHTTNVIHAGSPLNRVSFLRADHTFLSSALRHPSATFLLFRNTEPLISSPTSLARVSFADVEPVIGKGIFNTTEEDVIAAARTRMSGFKVPKAVLFTDAMPRTATGKIQKNVLREQHDRHFQD